MLPHEKWKKTMPERLRGSALAETALVMTAMLAMVFGIVQLGVIGFLQIMCDGAAFVAAHEYSLGNSAYEQYAKRPFPLLAAVFADLNGPDASATSVPVAFPTSSDAREGGVSLILPSHGQTTVTATAPTGLLGVGVAALSKVALHGTAIEPEYRLNNDVYDLAHRGYAGGSGQVDFFADQENTAFYYVSVERLSMCATKSITTSSGTTTPAISSFDSTNCPVANQVLRSLGTAEFLDQTNWFSKYGYLGVTSTGPGTFWEVLCHARMFAYAARNVFVPAATSASMPDLNVQEVETANQDWPQSQTAAGIVGQIYTMDATFPLNFASDSLTWAQTGLTPYALQPQSYCSYYLQ